VPSVDRRRFLTLAGATAATAWLPSIARAASIEPASVTGTLRDIEHIVVLMQENRSFDHYFGTLRGVRGFGDPRPVLQSNGKPVWHQPSGSGDVLPFHPTAANLGLQFIKDLDHSWNGTHQAFDGGKYDAWVTTKSAGTMAHLTRDDIPFHYALADAFTICDAYHCSLLSSTDPNRYYMFSGYVGNDGTGGGPVLGNEEAGYSWTTYPERLQNAGISWKVYQDAGTGLNGAGGWGWTGDAYIGNYGDNSLLYFDQYRNATPGSPLYERARTGTSAATGESYTARLRADCLAGELPQVSWICAPEAFSEHPNFPANYGAWYVAQVLDALTANPDVWSRTALLVTYDENDGFFDHVVPPFPPASAARGLSTADVTQDLFTAGTPAGYATGPYGLGPRVPMIVVSPFSRGGWVCSQTFDHTSILRFIGQRFGVGEPHISPWRRTVCGDLTSAFDFSRADTSAPALPSTTGYEPPDHDRHPDYVPTPPAQPAMPRQEPGLRNARALPYTLAVDTHITGGRMQFDFINQGAAGAAFHVTSTHRSDGPWPYTVDAGRTLSDTWAMPSDPDAHYDFAVHGPGGFYHRLSGTIKGLGPRATARNNSDGTVTVTVINTTGHTVTYTVNDAYGSITGSKHTIDTGYEVILRIDTSGAHHWYDISVTCDTDPGFVRRFAGHVETGQASTSDPGTLTT
jgi:phospholipase C